MNSQNAQPRPASPGDAAALRCPESVAHPLIGWVGFAVSCLLLTAFAASGMAGYKKAVVVIGVVALAMAAVDLALFRVHRRPTTGLDWSRFTPDPARVGFKLLGLAGCFGTVCFAFFLFPEYRGAFYLPLQEALIWAGPVMVGGVLIYVPLIDGLMVQPRDGYYATGRALTGQWRGNDWFAVRATARAWAVKGFFIPLMFVYLAGNMANWPNLSQMNWTANVVAFSEVSLTFLYTLDLLIAMCGYVFALRLFDSHDRSNEPTMLGWVVALVCYQPIWSLMSSHYFNYGDETTWVQALAGQPLIQTVWGLAIVGFTAIYAWATWAFGMRFSNLSNRGVVTCGPYRWTKHPAYVTKNITWWMIAVPFLPYLGWADAVRQCLMLLMVNLIYFARAWTEERHMCRDPDYRAYQDWMARHGLFRWLPVPWPRTSVGGLRPDTA